MGLALLDFLTPWRRTRVSKFLGWKRAMLTRTWCMLARVGHGRVCRLTFTGHGGA